MVLLTKLTLALSRVHPLAYLLTFLIAIPSFAFLYFFATPKGFYAPYSRYEPRAVSDTLQLASLIETALHRSLDARPKQESVVGNWKLDPDSVRVDNVNSTDGTNLWFRVSFSADGIGESSGMKRANWSIFLTVSERPTHAIISGDVDSLATYRVPDIDFSRYTSPFKEQYEELFRTVFGQKEFFGIPTPALALKGLEELQFREYLHHIKGDPATINADLPRMIYLSAVVITTLGFGDILPVTPGARILVAMEAITGIVFAGLFLNALAYHAISSLGQTRESESGRGAHGGDT